MAVDLNGPEAPVAVAVLLHPDPRMGGNRHHPLVDDLWRSLPDDGIGAIRFDFEGVDRDRSIEQVVEAMDAASSRWPMVPVVLVGYSFGAGIAAHVADDRIAGWYLVAPQVGRLVGSPLGADDRPVVIVVPELDQFSPPAEVRAATEGWVNTTVDDLPGDHFLAESIDMIEAGCRGWVVATSR